MGIMISGSAVAAIRRSREEVLSVYYRGSRIWPAPAVPGGEAGPAVLSCYGGGSWHDDYPWTDDTPWED